MKRVLIVEDNKKASLLVAKILKELESDLEIVFATNCDEAKQQLLGDDFRLFVVDILLNGNNPNDATGLDFVQFLRNFKKYEYTPVVITTSVAEMKDHAYDNLDCYKYLCFLQALFGQNCKIFLDIVAKRFWTLLHVQIGQSCNATGWLCNKPAASHCRHYLIVTAQDTETAVPNSHLRVHVP